MQRLIRLRLFSRKTYKYEKSTWRLIKDEAVADQESGGKVNTFIKNFSGGVSIN